MNCLIGESLFTIIASLAYAAHFVKVYTINLIMVIRLNGVQFWLIFIDRDA